jgi:hypothetical protein
MLRLSSSARRKMHEAAMVYPGGIALSLSGGTSITIDIPFPEAVLFG